MSSLFEFIESLQRPTGDGPLALHVQESLRTVAFPPGVTATVVVSLDSGNYAAIGSRIAFSPDVVPNAFYGRVQQLGHQMYGNMINDTLIKDGLELYVVVTAAAPITYVLTNMTPQVHFFNLLDTYALVYTETDYLYILEALDDEANKGGVAGAASLAHLLRDAKPPLLPTAALAGGAGVR